MKITTNRKHLEFKCSQLNYTDALKAVIQLMEVALYPQHKDCIGLAHNQIRGNKAVFIAKINKKWRAFINPEITFYSKENFKHSESCMSFPNKHNKVVRHNKVILRHETQEGFIKEEFTGFNACIIQHEIDHLDGKHIFNKEEMTK